MHKYIIATTKDWNINQYYRSVYKKRKNWYLITDPKKLTFAYVKSVKPKYIFFPHWSKKVNSKIINNYECVCFHETDVPYGRGGSPIQNQIIKGLNKTKISAFKIEKKLDSGKICLKRNLSLAGNASSIFKRMEKSSAQVSFIMPKLGIEEWDKPGEPAHDPEGLESFLDEIRIINKNNVIYHEINAHINDQVFADKALEILDDWIEKGIIST